MLAYRLAKAGELQLNRTASERVAARSAAGLRSGTLLRPIAPGICRPGRVVRNRHSLWRLLHKLPRMVAVVNNFF